MRHLTFILFFFAIYLPLPLPLFGGWFVPNLPGLLLGLVAFPSARRHGAAILLTLVVLAAYCVLNGLFATTVVTPPVERVKGSLQLLYFSGLALVIANSGLFAAAEDRRWQGALLMALGIGLLCGGYLEDKTPLGAVSDRFRGIVYGGGSIYNDDKRDLVLSSGIRPKMFASEPAAAALGTSVFLTTGAVCLMRLGPLLLAAAGCLAAARVFGSPIPVAFAVTLLAGAIPSWSNLRKPGSQWGMIAKQVTALVAGGLFLILAVMFIQTLRVRFTMAMDGSDRSSYLRMLHLMFVAGDAMKVNPLFAAGIGGEVEVADSLFVEGLEGAKANTLLNNPIWTIPLFGGITASVVAVVAISRMLTRLALHQRVLFAMFVVSVMLSGGSIVNTSAWIAGGLMFGILKSADNLAKTVKTNPAVPAQPAPRNPIQEVLA